jgi:hypothetical protein
MVDLGYLEVCFAIRGPPKDWLGSSLFEPLLAQRMGRPFNVRNIRSRFGKMLEGLDIENKVGDDNENFRGDLHPYISVCTNIRLPIKEAGLPLDALVAYGRSIMH